MKTLLLTTVLTAALTLPVLAQTPPAQVTPQQQQMSAMQQTLLQSDQSRMEAYLQHKARIDRAFGRRANMAAAPQTTLPQTGGASNLNTIAPAAGNNDGTAMRSRLQQQQYQHPGVADPKDLPLMTGNIPR